MGYDIAGKTILITGANRGIGKALVDAFVEHRAGKIYAAVRKLASASSLVEEHGGKVVPILIDLADPDSIASAAERAGDVHVVVNNAGVLTTTSPLDDNAIESLQYETEVNVYGQIRMARAFAPVLRANGGGVFAQLNSVVSMKCFSNVATYSASKAASYAVTQALRELLGEQGTLVISVHPGPIASDMSAQAGLEDIAESPSVVADALLEALRTGRFHVFPDSMAKQVGDAYDSFAENVILAEMAEA